MDRPQVSAGATGSAVAMDRASMWARLGADVDVLVIGGGIVGAGIARDAARRGLSVAVCEMNDLAYGTSSRSSKLVHGGLRYLEQYEFSLVFESVSERRLLMDLAPHLVNPLGFLFPIYEGSKHNLFVIRAGMWLYDGLSLFRSPKRHRQLGPTDIAKEEPSLGQKGLKGAPLYYDCSTDDARLTLETAIDAARSGAVIATWAKVERVIKGENGRVRGALVKDELTGAEKEIRAACVINATGPWTDTTMTMTDKAHKPVLRPTKGVHIVVDSAKLPLNNAVVCFHPDDKRVLFAIPWGDRAYIGTTDTDYSGDPADVAATREDVDYLVKASNAYFPEHLIGPDDVIATWAGLRPLIGPPEGSGVSESQVSREHQIIVGQDGMVTIAGGKLTTYRRMSAEVVESAVRLLELSGSLRGRDLTAPRTDKQPLPGGEGWPEDDDHTVVEKQIVKESGGRIGEASAAYLASTYGTRALELARMCAADARFAEPLVPGRPELAAQIDYGVREELAATVCDMMIRRTQLFFRDVDQGLGATERVARRMAELLHWNGETLVREITRYRDEVERSRAWRSA